MRNDFLYQKLQDQLKEVTVVSPQTVGPFTFIYKKATSWIKTWPIKILIPLAFLGGILFQLTFGERIVRLVSVLQIGF